MSEQENGEVINMSNKLDRINSLVTELKTMGHTYRQLNNGNTEIDGVVVQKLQVNQELRRLYQTEKSNNKSMLLRALQE